MWSLNHFLLSGPGSCRPSSHAQGFKGNSVSITKRRQPTETHEERLGHPPNQRPGELTRPIPTRACPGNIFDSVACMHTDASLSASKTAHFAQYYNSPNALNSKSESYRHETCAFNEMPEITALCWSLLLFPFFPAVLFLLIQGAILTRTTWHYL